MTSLPLIENCNGCGLCCETQGGLPITWYTIIAPEAELPPELRAEIADTARRWNGLGVWQGPGDESPCVWYDRTAKRCCHYDYRPDICQEFELGGEDCRAYRRQGLKKEPDHA